MSSLRKVPEIISVVVYSAKGLKSRKDEHCKFTVVFGIGSKKFKTDTVEDFHGCPTFNTEMEINVSDPTSSLSFKVVEKHSGDTLGQIIVPIYDLPNNPQDAFRTIPFQPYKKNTAACGELNFKAWISMYKKINEDDAKSIDSWKKSMLPLGLSKIKDKLLYSGHKNESSGNKQQMQLADPSSNLYATKRKSFSNIQEFFSPSMSQGPQNISDDSKLMTFNNNSCDSGSNIKPEVSGVSPKEGPLNGGTKLTIRGQNLGRNKEDVIGLYVCGSNVLSSLEYISSNKLICTTKPWKAGSGNVSVETQSGGRGVSLVQFCFVNPPQVFEGREAVEASGSFLSSDSRRSSNDSSSPHGSLKKSHIDLKNQRSKSLWTLSKDKDSPETTMAVAESISSSSSFEKEPILKPEITGVSPKEAPYYKPTKLTIRGAHLGDSNVDILKIMVCGKDYINTLEYESPSKIICHVGPVSKPTWGSIMVETISGGVGVSLVEFKFIDDNQRPKEGVVHVKDQVKEKEEDGKGLNKVHDEYAGVPYSAQKSNASPISHEVSATKAATTAIHFTQHGTEAATTILDSATAGVTAMRPTTTTTPMTLSTLTSSSLYSSNTNAVKPSALTTSTSSRSSVAPPIVEIQPIQRTRELDQITILENKLKVRDREIEELVSNNKKLSEECSRLKEYMQLLVSRAMVECPQILAIESQFH